MPPNFFSYATLKEAITFDSDGLLVMVEDTQPEDGYLTIIDIPKDPIKTPGLDESTVPKLNSRDILNCYSIQEAKPDIESMLPILPEHIMNRIKLSESEQME